MSLSIISQKKTIIKKSSGRPTLLGNNNRLIFKDLNGLFVYYFLKQKNSKPKPTVFLLKFLIYFPSSIGK
jgi:hypothetical protein